MYITADCYKLTGREATQASKQENTDRTYAKTLASIKQVGVQSQDPRDLRYWGLPPGILASLEKHTKIKSLFEWQADCLSHDPAVAQGHSNLVYFAPTSGGKSIVSEILMLRAILGFKKRALYILPFISIVNEKCQVLSKICENVNLKIVQMHSQSDA